MSETVPVVTIVELTEAGRSGPQLQQLVNRIDRELVAGATSVEQVQQRIEQLRHNLDNLYFNPLSLLGPPGAIVVEMLRYCYGPQRASYLWSQIPAAVVHRSYGWLAATHDLEAPTP